MKFSIGKQALTRALSIVGKGTAPNSTLPIITGIHMDAKDGQLVLTGTDLVISVRTTVDAEVEEPGATVISYRLLASLVKELPDAPVIFEGTDTMVSIACENSRFNLNTLSAVDFPEFPTYELENSATLPRETLNQMVNKVYKVTSKDTSRPILTGVLLQVEDGLLRLVATDSYRLAVCDTPVEGDAAEAISMIIPGKALHDALSIPTDSKDIVLGATEAQVVFQIGPTVYISRRIEGNFPDYRQLLPDKWVTRLDINAENFNAVLHRVSVVAQSNPSVRLDVDPENNLLTLSAMSTDQGDAREYLTVACEGEPLSIALNYKYVFDCLSVLSGKDDVVLELQGSMQPAIFRDEDKINYLYLLMPVRL